MKESSKTTWFNEEYSKLSIEGSRHILICYSTRQIKVDNLNTARSGTNRHVGIGWKTFLS